MRSFVGISINVVAIALLLVAGCKDSGTGSNNDQSVVHDLAVTLDQGQSYAGNQCGTTAVCSGTTDICCGDGTSAPNCAASCNKTFSFKCDGPEDCGNANAQACCLTIHNPGQTTHTFASECTALADCAPTLSITANPTVTARCHTNADCAPYSTILSKCCHNVGEDNLTFCATPISNDAGVNVVCQP